MVPPEFLTFFVTCAQAAAALIGLLFVAVSIAPEATVMADAPMERQAVAASVFTALVTAFFISFAAQMPHFNLGFAAAPMGLVGLLNTLSLLRSVARARLQRAIMLRALLLVAVSTAIYVDVAWQGVQLVRHPSDVSALYTLDALLIGIFAVGLIRAWELLGARRYGLLSRWFNPLRDGQPTQPGTRR